MFRKILTAGFIATVTSFGAMAANGPVIMDEVYGGTLTYEMPSANIVGRADATVSGNEDDHDYMTQRVLATQRPNTMYGFDVRQNWTVRVDSNS